MNYVDHNAVFKFDVLTVVRWIGEIWKQLIEIEIADYWKHTNALSTTKNRIRNIVVDL